MASFVGRPALAALVFGAVALLNSQASAITTVAITGDPVAGYPGNGTAIGQNNVMNAPNSGLVDGAPIPGGYLLGTGVSGGASVSVTGTSGGFWGVNWWFAGAESGDTIQLIANSTVSPATVSFTENNQNNNTGDPGSAQVGPLFLGTTFQKGDGLIKFLVKDNTTGSLVNNLLPGTNAVPNTDGASSLVFSFLTAPIIFPSILDTLKTTNVNSLWFMLAFNDNGSSDDNHDDFVGFAEVFAVPPGAEIPGVPLPPALVLFGSALIGLTLLARRRRVAHHRTSAAV